MVRKVKAGGAPVTEAAAAFGYSRPAYYEAAAALESSGLEGLVPARPGPRGGAQAHRADPRLGRGAAGRRPGAAPGAAAGPDRGRLRRARAPPLGRESAGPPPGAPLQKPLTCPPARCGRRMHPSLSLRPSPGHAAAEPGARPDAGQDSAPGGGLDARYEQLRHAALHARAEAFPLGLGVLTRSGVTAWQRALASLAPADRAGGPAAGRPAPPRPRPPGSRPRWPPSSSAPWPPSRSPEPSPARPP